jgi:hypothetical protein
VEAVSVHPIRKLIYESLVHSPKGFDLDPKRAAAITAQLSGNDPATVKAFHETVGMLQTGGGQPAAAALLALLLKSPAAKTGGWAAR